MDKDKAAHINLGRDGEELAVAHLVKNGFTIRERNWRYGRYEIDIIAASEKKLHFVEVKTRSSNRYGPPEIFVSPQKFKYLKQAAEAYLYRHPKVKLVQFDIISITIREGKEPELLLIRDVYF